jgi:hypothetical protein
MQPAYELANLLGGQVRLFPDSLPSGTDYIDYRKLGYTAEDFLQDVVGVAPITKVDDNLVDNIIALWKVGDKQKLAEIHATMDSYGQVAQDIARVLAQRGPIGPFTPLAWANVCKLLWSVKTGPELVSTISIISQAANRFTASAW